MKLDENKNVSPFSIFIVIFIIAMLIVTFSGSGNSKKTSNKNEQTPYVQDDGKFRIIASQENKSMEEVVTNYAKSKGYEVEFEYAGSLEIMQKLNKGEKYDAVWLSNSIWGYMLDSSVKMTNSKCTNISPVIFGIKKSKAEELGFVGKTVYTKDIVKAIQDGKLKFSMSNPTVTNSGASAYLGLLSTLAGNPEVLTKEHLENAELKNNLKTLFSGMERSSGDEEFLEELFLNGNYEAVVAYESSIIDINKKLQENGKETLYAIYPVDGVSISDSPFAYIDNKNTEKKDVFEDIQTYILSNEGQKLLQQKGKRTWYGGTNENVDKSIFNPDWGIDTNKYISPIKYPSTEVIKLALNMYQTELRKPVHVVFCLDYSGSMSGEGERQLKSAMDYVLTEKAANDFIQFAEGDKIDVIPFSSIVKEVWSAKNGNQTADLLEKINKHKSTGTTALYLACQEAVKILKDEDMNKYNVSVVLMTDGQGNVGTFKGLEAEYKKINKQIPVYSIMFGEAMESQLKEISNMSNGKVFDGKTDLVKAFKEVRGYN
jgi:Ca-activated chloride channel family protein